MVLTKEEIAIIENTMKRSKKFKSKTMERLIETFLLDHENKSYKKADIRKKFGNSFIDNFIGRALKGDRNLFHNYFLEKYGYSFEKGKERSSFTGGSEKESLQKIQTEFKEFINFLRDNDIERWSPKTLRKYSESFYGNIVGKKYSYDRESFLNVVDPKRESKFQRKNSIYTPGAIKKEFEGFKKRLMEKGRKEWAPSDFKAYSSNVYVSVVGGKYGYDRDKFIGDVDPLGESGFKRKNKNYSLIVIQKEFSDFLEYLEKNEMDKWSASTLEAYSENYYVGVVCNKYESDRDIFFDAIGYTDRRMFQYPNREVKRMTESVRVKRFGKLENFMKRAGIGTLSPWVLHNIDSRLYEDLRRFRDGENRIDRLYIVNTYIKDPEVRKKFTHVSNPLVSGKIRSRTYDNYVYDNMKADSNPETILVQKEQKNLLSQAIMKLTGKEQSFLESYLDGEQVSDQELGFIIEKLKQVV